jgi:phage anti-repressor protein
VRKMAIQLKENVIELFFRVRNSLDAGTAVVDSEHNEVYHVSFNNIYHWFDTQKSHAARRLKATLLENEYVHVPGKVTEKGLTPNEYYITVDGFKAFALASPGDNVKRVRRYYIALEKEYINLTERSMHHAERSTVSSDPSLGSAFRILEQKQFEVAQLQSYIQLKKDENRVEVSVSDAEAAKVDAKRAAEEAQGAAEEAQRAAEEAQKVAEEAQSCACSTKGCA